MSMFMLRKSAQFLFSLMLVGCYDPIGDAICNGLQERIHVVVTTTTGEQQEFFMDPMSAHGFRLGGPRYQTIEVMDADGGRLTMFSRSAVQKENLSQYAAGNSLMFLVTEQGIHPVPVEYHNNWKAYLGK